MGWHSPSPTAMDPINGFEVTVNRVISLAENTRN